MCLLHSSLNSTAVAILHRDHDQRLILSCHDLVIKRLELSSGQSIIIPEVHLADEGCCHLLPVTSDNSIVSKGVLTLGGDNVSFFLCQSREGSQKKKAGGRDIQSEVSTAHSRVEWKFSSAAT